MDIMTDTRRRNGAIKMMHVISNAKILRFWLSTFFLLKISVESVERNDKLMDHVCFVHRALFFLTESGKNHVLNTMN